MRHREEARCPTAVIQVGSDSGREDRDESVLLTPPAGGRAGLRVRLRRPDAAPRILVREYFGGPIMVPPRSRRAGVDAGHGTGAAGGGWAHDAFGSYAWLFVGSSGIGLGAVALASTVRPPRARPDALATPSLAR
jgi:hypothetical protein